MMLKIDSVHKHFGGIRALDGCSLNIEKNRITAIIGPNGSGKTTLFNVISKILSNEKGSIIFDGKDTTKQRDYQVAKQEISRTFQEVRLFRNLTIAEHIEIALSNDDESILRSLTKNSKNKRKKINDILKSVKLDKPLDTYATDLSYGQRKLLDLAVAIAKPRKLLMLDEPVAGINPKLRKEIKQIIRKLHNKGETIIVIEHDMNFVMDLADHIIVLDAGKVIAEGKPEDIQNNQIVLDAYLGE